MLIPEARILDLFSGSGALGLEALSRGADSVVFVEENSKASQLIRENAKTLKLEDQIRILNKKVEQMPLFLKEEPPFDLVFMDPPYEKGFEEKLLNEWPWSLILNDGGRLCIESAYRKSGPFDAPQGLKIVRNERYGDSQLVFYAKVEGVLES
jgi:16S rRNA (guanine(966)-N(2))-methyltransferase RsmD